MASVTVGETREFFKRTLQHAADTQRTDYIGEVIVALDRMFADIPDNVEVAEVRRMLDKSGVVWED